MNADVFVSKIKDIEKNYKTVYAYGVFGAPITEKLIRDKSKQYPRWYTAARQANLRMLINKGYFGFDCVNLFKGVLWGWSGDPTKTYGGASYNTNGVPDISADQLIQRCTNVGTSFKNMSVGEILWTNGHVGVYIGNGLAIECTPKWSNDVQITAVGNIGSKTGYNVRTWKKHGKMPYIKYGGGNSVSTLRYGKTLRQGDKGSAVKRLQQDLMGLGYNLSPYNDDGSLGSVTAAAIRKFQRDNGLSVDGIAGPATQGKITEKLSTTTDKYEKLYKEAKKELDSLKKKIKDLASSI